MSRVNIGDSNQGDDSETEVDDSAFYFGLRIKSLYRSTPSLTMRAKLVSLLVLLLAAIVSEGRGISVPTYKDLGIPPSTSTVDVKIINAVLGTNNRAAASSFVFPVVPGTENFVCSIYAFLIEHHEEKLMFDIGLRKDTQNLSPFWVAIFDSGILYFNITEDVPTQLVKGGVSLESVKTVIWR
jgi:hypothetical protein